MRRALAAAVALVAALAVGAPGPAGADAQATGVRLAGNDRIETAIAVSKATFVQPGSARAAVLARSDGFADALAGTPLAVNTFAPILLTGSTALDPRVDTELKRVLPAGQTVYLLGLQGALSDAVAAQVTADGYKVSRLGGADRFETAVAVAKAVPVPMAILLATGDNPGDALAGGAAAVQAKGVVLLTNDSVMPAATQQYISDHSSLPQYALGAPAAAAAPAAKAIFGADRYETSVRVAQQFFPSPANLGFANGFAYPDALAGGAAIGEAQGPLLLVAPDLLPDVVHQYTVSVSPTVHIAEVYGGQAVIPDGVLAAIDSAIRGN